MRINNPAIFDYIKEANGANMRCKVIPIGDWNMDADFTINVAHGLTFANIRHISVQIRNDADTQVSNLNIDNNFNGANGYYLLAGANVSIARKPAGYFDSVNYDAISYNRGWIWIWYVD